MNPLVTKIIGVLVRAALVAIGASLVQQGTLTQEQAEHLTSSQTIQTIVGVLAMLGPVLYSAWDKVHDLREKVAALHLQPNATLAEIKVRAAQPDISASDLKRS